MRALIFELRPGNLEQDGLIQALRTHSAALQGRIGLPVVVESDLDGPACRCDVEEVLYRIAQEALHNVVKHAGARQVRLEVGRVPDGVRLRIADDGKRLRPDHRPRRPPRPGRDAGPGRPASAARSTVELEPGDAARRSRSSCPTRAIERPRRRRAAGSDRRASRSDDG